MPPPKTTNVDTNSGSFGKRNRRGSAAKAPNGGTTVVGSFTNALRGSLNFNDGGREDDRASSRGVPLRQVSTVELEDGSTIAMDLNIVLSNDNYFRYMVKHQEAEYTSENLIFWKAVDKLKRQKDFSKESTMLLYNTYIKNGVEMQVNISQGEREKIEAALGLGAHLAAPAVDPGESPPEEIPTNIFNVAQNEVYMMLKGDLYPRFKESPQFKEMLRQEVNGEQEEPKKKRNSIVEILTSSENNLERNERAPAEKPKGSGACHVM
eukprot:CAMPEP_0182567806 /NCGR_PEP_ID=MMETSP1324-20130603/8921_1 /TAXON_ID=236786 /ORGANISM="Florenciella sp., Strain RCC1587" /LENGTH=264 /DNA_ID=CAMNT_0024781855 /DNA_START=15 /DNA_END=809 /DNA_ORIENTATION=-